MQKERTRIYASCMQLCSLTYSTMLHELKVQRPVLVPLRIFKHCAFTPFPDIICLAQTLAEIDPLERAATKSARQQSVPCLEASLLACSGCLSSFPSCILARQVKQSLSAQVLHSRWNFRMAWRMGRVWEAGRTPRALWQPW